MKKNKGIKIARIIISIFFAILVIGVLVVFILARVNASPVFLFNKTSMWVMTNSMDPTIPPKTYILVEKATADDVEEGDIIVFKSTDPRIQGHYNTHRIISKNGDTIITKGDNNIADDGAYSAKAENIVGKYVKKLPVLTFLGRILITPVGFIIIILLFLVTIGISIAPDFKAAMKAKAKEDKEKEIRRLIDEEVQKLKETGTLEKEEPIKEKENETNNEGGHNESI